MKKYYKNFCSCSLRLKSGFTLAELLVALVVIAIVVSITLPITLNKMGKATYASYWSAYESIKNISSLLYSNNMFF